jgi:two-component sensor histidine kinase
MEFLFRILPGPQPIAIRYAATALLVLVAFLIRYAIGESAGPYAFLIFVLPIVASGVMFDRGAGFFATAISAILIASLLTWDERANVHVAALALFLFVSSCLVFVADALRQALDAYSAARKTTHLLLQEMTHRVKNKFSVISSIIALQSRHASPEARKALENVGSRIKVIAAVHNHLQLSRHDGRIEMKAYLEGLCHLLKEMLDSNERSISLTCSAAELSLPTDKALAVGILVNELVTNAFKYAFFDGGGRVEVNMTRQGDSLLLSVSDDGKGCPSQPQEGLGTQLVKTFSEQLGGVARWNEGTPTGCVVVVEFPAPLMPSHLRT